MIVLLSKDDEYIKIAPYLPNTRILRINVDQEILNILIDTYIKDEK